MLPCISHMELTRAFKLSQYYRHFFIKFLYVVSIHQRKCLSSFLKISLLWPYLVQQYFLNQVMLPIANALFEYALTGQQFNSIKWLFHCKTFPPKLVSIKYSSKMNP